MVKKSIQSREQTPMLTIIYGADEFLNSRLTKSTISRYSSLLPDADVVSLEASTCSVDDLQEAISPSLFGTSHIVVINHGEDISPEVVETIIAYCDQIQAETAKDEGYEQEMELNRGSSEHSLIIFRHNASIKGRQYIKKMLECNAFQINVPDLTKLKSKISYVKNIFKEHKRVISEEAAQLLAEVLGEDTGILTGLCEQLCDDFDDKNFTAELVREYLIADPTIKVFDIINAALEGKKKESFLLLRSACEQGVAPLMILGAFASQMRTLIKIIGLHESVINAQTAKIQPWLMRSMGKYAKDWNSERISYCMEKLAWADEQCKIGGGDPLYILESVMRVILSRGQSIEIEQTY